MGKKICGKKRRSGEKIEDLVRGKKIWSEERSGKRIVDLARGEEIK